MRKTLALIIVYLTVLAGFGFTDMPMPVLTVEFAPGDNWNDASPTWVDITDQVRHQPGFRIRRGRQTPFTRMRPSTLTLTLDNSTGNFDPDNSAGDYATDLVPMVPIRVQATHNAVTYDLFRGFVMDWAVTQRDFADTMTQVQAIDGLSVIQLFKIASVYVEEITADTPSAWFRFSDAAGATTAIDASSNGFHGTYSGSPTLGTSGGAIQGETDLYAAFDGTDDYMTVPTGANFTADPLSLEIWFRTSSDASGGAVALFSQESGQSDTVPAADLGTIIFSQGSDNKFGFSGFFDSSIWLVRSGSTLNDGEWHHAALTISGAGAIKSYFDGAAGATDTQAVSINPVGQQIHVGRGRLAGSDFFTGDISEVVQYNSELSAARVTAHFDAGNAPWADDLTSGRVTNVLDTIGWPAADRTLSTGVSTMQSVTSGNFGALSAAFAAQDTEDSELWIGGDGKVRFTNRHDRNLSAYAATFSNDTGGDSVYRDFVWVSDEQYLRNVAQIADSSAVVTESRDDASVTKYAPRSVARTSNTEDAAEIADYANWLQAEFGTSRTRGLLTLLNAQTSTNDSWAEMLSRELGDLISVENTPVSGGAQNQYDFFVEDLNLRGNVEGWEMRLGLSPAVRQRMFTLDRDPLGKLDRDNQGLLGW